jgi:transcriptional regulator with XRE-family HTH domain
MGEAINFVLEEFGGELRRLRLAKALTIRQVAKEVGTTGPNISTLERGQRRISIDKASQLAEYYGKRLSLRLLSPKSLETVCFVVVYNDEIHGVGLDSESAWREAELALNLERAALKDMGYRLREAKAIRE